MITEKGYTKKTYQEILDGKIQKAKELFGEDIDTSDLTPLGKYIRINAYDQAEAEETAEMLYYSIFPNTATGTSLDRLCPFAGITRNPAKAAVYHVIVAGEIGATIPAGFLVATDYGLQFASKEDAYVTPDGIAAFDAECTQTGTIGNVNPSDIKVIVNPTADVVEIANVSVMGDGAEAESDTSLRQRFHAAQEGSGSCSESAIQAALVRVNGVRTASVISNASDEYDGEDRPPHSFECYVACEGSDVYREVAETIFDKKPLGIATHGSVTQEVVDSSGTTHEVKFSPTKNINIQVVARLYVNAEFQGSDGVGEVKANLRDYINGLGVGGTVYISALYGKIHSVAGVVSVAELKLSTDGGETYTSGNVEISAYQSAVLEDAAVSTMWVGGEVE